MATNNRVISCVLSKRLLRAAVVTAVVAAVVTAVTAVLLSTLSSTLSSLGYTDIKINGKIVVVDQTSLEVAIEATKPKEREANNNTD
jgi:hypothetical protein